MAVDVGSGSREIQSQKLRRCYMIWLVQCTQEIGFRQYLQLSLNRLSLLWESLPVVQKIGQLRLNLSGS